MKKLIIILTTLLTLNGCQKIECPAFDFNHPINRWHWFPNNEDSYEFMDSDSATIVLIRTSFEFNQFEERNCHSCNCFSDLNAHYDFFDLSIQLRSTLSYQSDENSDEGSLYYGIDNIGSPFDPETITVSEVEVENSESLGFNVSLLDTLTVVDTTYLDVTQLSILDTTKTKVRKIWIIQDSGIIGLETSDNIWRKK